MAKLTLVVLGALAATARAATGGSGSWNGLDSEDNGPAPAMEPATEPAMEPATEPETEPDCNFGALMSDLGENGTNAKVNTACLKFAEENRQNGAVVRSTCNAHTTCDIVSLIQHMKLQKGKSWLSLYHRCKRVHTEMTSCGVKRGSGYDSSGSGSGSGSSSGDDAETDGQDTGSVGTVGTDGENGADTVTAGDGSGQPGTVEKFGDYTGTVGAGAGTADGQTFEGAGGLRR